MYNKFPNLILSIETIRDPRRQILKSRITAFQIVGYDDDIDYVLFTSISNINNQIIFSILLYIVISNNISAQ